MTGAISQPFEERLQEIDAYLELLEALELQLGGGLVPKIGHATVTSQQQKILYSSVYLQIYNLVEATVTWCMDAVCSAAADRELWQPEDLSGALRREWVRAIARTHTDLNLENRLDSTLRLFDHLVQSLPVAAWEVETSGGNWDDSQIELIVRRLGIELHVTKDVHSGVKRPIRDDKGPLKLVKDLRNRLAHGSISFSECGAGITVVDLKELKRKTADYLREVVAAFEQFIAAHEYLIPERRPEAGI